MPDPFNLTVDDIMLYDAGVYISVGVGKENKEKCNIIIKQILENQDKAELNNTAFRKFYDNYYRILQENKLLKENCKCGCHGENNA